MKKAISILMIMIAISIMTAGLMMFSACDKQSDNPYKTEFSNSDNPVVTINLVGGEYLKVELYPEVAPIAVKRFLDCCNDGFYDNKIFHRIVADFVVQGGGFYREGNNMIQSSTNNYPAIKGEFAANGYNNPLNHEFGVIAFGRLGQTAYSMNYDSATVQFYFCLKDLPSLDGNYVTFGRIVDENSADTLKRMGKVKTQTVSPLENVPTDPITIKNTRIEWNKYKQKYI